VEKCGKIVTFILGLGFEAWWLQGMPIFDCLLNWQASLIKRDSFKISLLGIRGLPTYELAHGKIAFLR